MIRRMTTNVRLCMVASLTLIASCNGGGMIQSGLPQDTPVDELSAADATRLCQSVDDYLFRIYPVTEEHRVSCTGTALSRTATEAACRDDVATCMMADFAGRDHLDCTSVETSGCTASVNQIETCIEDRARSFEQRAAEVQCTAAGDLEEIGRLITAIPLPATCTSLSAVCRAEIGI
jgi:hypothetical protein